MLSQASVILSRGGGGPAWLGARLARGKLCVAGGMRGKGEVVCGRCVWQGGKCMAGACVTGETTTAVNSTHPTGMHSCLACFLPKFA